MNTYRIGRLGSRALLAIMSFVAAGSISVVTAAPWDGYGRTYPVPRYELDPHAASDYRFDPENTFPPYADPPLTTALELPTPLDDPRLQSFDVIVIVNKRDDAFWGEAESLRAYKRGVGLVYYWLISTGSAGWETPSGYYTVSGFSSRHWSVPFDAPMFWSVFFNRGRALHSSLDRQALGDLGSPASHGCVHIEEYRAEALFHLIGESGYGPVERLDPKTGQQQVGDDGNVEEIEATKALIIVAPTRRYSVADRD